MSGDAAVAAICNLVAAIGTGMMTSGRAAEWRTMLSMFEKMNEMTIQDAAVLHKIKETVAAQRAVMDELGR